MCGKAAEVLAAIKDCICVSFIVIAENLKKWYIIQLLKRNACMCVCAMFVNTVLFVLEISGKAYRYPY